MKTAFHMLLIGIFFLGSGLVGAFFIIPLFSLGFEGYLVATSGCMTIAEVIAGVVCTSGAILAGRALLSNPGQRTRGGYTIFAANAAITAFFLFTISFGLYVMHS